jgi:hypothetical protein
MNSHQIGKAAGSGPLGTQASLACEADVPARLD